MSLLSFLVSALVVVRGAQSPTDAAAVVGVVVAIVTTTGFLGFLTFLSLVVCALVVVRGAQGPTDAAAVVGVVAAVVTTAAFLELFTLLSLAGGCRGWLAFPGPPSGTWPSNSQGRSSNRRHGANFIGIVFFLLLTFFVPLVVVISHEELFVGRLVATAAGASPQWFGAIGVRCDPRVWILASTNCLRARGVGEPHGGVCGDWCGVRCHCLCFRGQRPRGGTRRRSFRQSLLEVVDFALHGDEE